MFPLLCAALDQNSILAQTGLFSCFRLSFWGQFLLQQGLMFPELPFAATTMLNKCICFLQFLGSPLNVSYMVMMRSGMPLCNPMVSHPNRAQLQVICSPLNHIFWWKPFWLQPHNQLELSQQDRGDDLAKTKWQVGSRAATGMGSLDPRFFTAVVDEHSMNANPYY